MEQYYISTGIIIPILGYIDPGAGSMLLQVIISFIIGISFFFRRFIIGAFIWVRNKLFRRCKSESKPPS